MAILTDDQKMLQDTAATFLRDEGGPDKQMRHWRDTGCKDGFGHDLWRQFGELGLSAATLPESAGGLGLGAVEAALVLEEIGRNLTPSPFLMTARVAAKAIEGSAQADHWYPRIVAGEAVLSLAVDEGPRHDPAAIALTAARKGNGFVLDGTKQMVVQGGSADMVVAAARMDEGVTLFAVPRDAAELDNVTLADGSKAARMRFDGVELDGDAVIGEVGGGQPALDAALNAGRAGAAAEMVGAASGIFATTVDYLAQRKQFGRAIGEFQALQHRAAHLYGEIEIARAAALKAAQALDGDDPDAALHVAVAKAKAGSVAGLAVREGVQMHGGIGMTDEHDAGLFMKRVAVLEALFGDTFYQRGRVAALSGY